MIYTVYHHIFDKKGKCFSAKTEIDAAGYRIFDDGKLVFYDKDLVWFKPGTWDWVEFDRQ